jgi:hypothetical protein
MLNQPYQYELNKNDDYTRTLKKQIVKRDDALLRTQAKQLIPPQGVIRRHPPAAAAASKYERRCGTSGPNGYDYGSIARRRRITQGYYSMEIYPWAAVGQRREVESNANTYAEFACVVPYCLKE